MNEEELFKQYPLLKKCTPEVIKFSRDIPGFGRSIYIPPEGNKKEFFSCEIHSDLDEYQQALTLLHELYHDYPGFRPKDYKGGCTEKFDRECEEGIEKVIYEIIQKDSIVREFLVKQIRLAKVRLIRESISEKNILQQKRIKNLMKLFNTNTAIFVGGK